MSIIFDALNQLLTGLYSFLGDWGLTIVAVTVIIRVCMIPVSFKQKVSIRKQQMLSKKMEEVKSIYKDDKQKLDQEMMKLSSESAKTLLGCLVTLIQLPIMYSLYSVFTKMPVEHGSIIVPWVANLNMPDIYFIIPIVATLMQLMPNILLATGMFKSLDMPKPTKGQMLVTVAINMLFMVKAPVTIGIYWAASGLFSLLEQVLYGFYIRKKCLN